MPEAWRKLVPKCNTRRMCGACDDCYPRSFAAHPRAANWSDWNELTARQVFRTSNLPYWFQCDVCLHHFEATANNIKTDKFCGYCSTPCKKLCWDLGCEWCYWKSFASHAKSLYWSPLNSVESRQVFMWSNTKYIFDCPTCSHSFAARPNDIVSKRSWCPYCSIPGKKLCSDADCAFCLARSFASHPRAVLWSDRNDLQPRDVMLGCNKKFWFNCDICGESFLQIVPDSVRGRGCPTCRNKTETKLLRWFRATFSQHPVKHQPRYDWCRSETTNQRLPFDFVFESLKLIVELDGRQHVVQVRNWRSPEDQHIRDVAKMELAMSNGYTVVRIFQEPVWEDKDDWARKLALFIRAYDAPMACMVRLGKPYWLPVKRKLQAT